MDGNIEVHQVDVELTTVMEVTANLSPVTEITGNIELPALRPIDKYAGPYEVTPVWTEQRLETEGKQMTDDIKVNEIPIYKTSNPSGGDTIIIGG